MARPDITKHAAAGLEKRRQLRDERRKRVKEMMTDGLAWAEIRRRLGVSSATIRNDRKAIAKGEVE